MIDLIAAALQYAFVVFEADDEDEFELDGLNYAYHCGEAAGIAAAAGIFGVKALEMCDDISDAYEDCDLDFMRYILREASERPDSGDEHYARTRESEIHALEFGAALQEAMRAQEEGDLERRSLMIGFTAGLMFRYQDADDGAVGAVRAKIISGYETDSNELLQEAQGTLAFGARMSDPMGLIGKEESARYYEERMRTMRWVQNFGLREARSTDEAVVAPNSLSINYQLLQQADGVDVTNKGGEVEQYEEITVLEEEDSLEGAPEAAAHVSSGIEKQKIGDYDGAIADFDRAIEIDPENVGAFVNRAVCKQNKDDHLGAIADWDCALELKPDDGGWYVNRGIVKETIGDYDGALADYTRAAEVEPDYEVAYIARAYIKTQQRDYEGAIADYDRVIELWPDNAAAFDDRGLAKRHQGNIDEAIVDFDRAIELQPSNADYYLNRGTAKASAKDYLGAISDFARAIELDPGKASTDHEPEARPSSMAIDSGVASRAHVENPPHPIEMCYWVIPGKLLAGEYPRTPHEESSKEKLAALIGAGVSAFIDLTEDSEPLKPYAYLLHGPSHERFPIPDQRVPKTDALTKRALDAIDRHLDAGDTVYVHCWGGVGRTGTIIGCWLSRHHEPGQAALNRLQELWEKNPKSGWRRSPENKEQEEYIQSWGDKEVPIAARYQGCLTGLAAGDAVGTTVEFKAPGTFTPVADMVGGGPFHLQPGQWTDDTSMALCLAESLIECEMFVASDQMDRYVRWWREGHLSSTGSFFDIGNATADALRRYQQTKFAMAGSTDLQSAGNGSLMRLAPVAMFFATDPELAIRLCGESSRTTHSARTCIDACRYFGGLIVGALRGATKDELLSERYCPVPRLWERVPLCAEIDEIAAGSFKRRQPPEIVGSGYVVKSLEAALWAFHRSETFKEGCLLAVNLGDDADTTAAIYGQIAGAYYGVDAIPSGWRDKLAARELISKFADGLFVRARGRTE